MITNPALPRFDCASSKRFELVEPAELLEGHKNAHLQFTSKANSTYQRSHFYLSGLAAASDCCSSGLSSKGCTVVGEESDAADAAAVELAAEVAGDGGGADKLGFTFNII